MELIQAHKEKQALITQRLKQFSAISTEQDFFYELCFCILTPQSKGIRCGKIVDILKQKDFFHCNFNLVPLLKSNTRFHHTKARHLNAMKQEWTAIHQTLTNTHDSLTLRTWLTNNVKGIGMKEASHYLRNTGHRGLAILDRHILKHLHRHGVIPRFPKTLTPALYNHIEQRFIAFSKKIGIDMDELDLLFWSTETGEIYK